MHVLRRHSCSHSAQVSYCAPFAPAFLFSTTQNTEETEYGWNDLVANGYIEYVDTEEEETTMIAMNIKDLQAARQNPQVSERNWWQ